ncbi:MAG TPA: phosphatidylglycerol lysyltransferase domain-containing protein [Candidatus Dormibacteraeota bacterium]|nr:phosphatidylglycerol lysyltransferase domain-containing protein [Candidatus Dormibacteraeota bacterium]
MDSTARIERRRVRWFFAGLLVVSAVLDIVGTLVVTHQTRTQVLEALLPTSVTLGGRTGAVLAGLGLLLLAGGIARGKRVAFRLTLVVLGATIAFELVKDLDFEAAALFAWILFGLWWFRSYFDADSDPSRMRWGLVVLLIGVFAAVAYAVGGAAMLQGQLRPEFGLVRTLESLLLAVSGSPIRYRAVTERADWFLGSLPVVAYVLIIGGLTQLLRPVLAPRAAATERERVHALLSKWGRNYISHLAVHGASSYHWIGDQACVAFTLRGRTALALGDPVGPGLTMQRAVREFVGYCEKQDWIAAFYQVDEAGPYRSAGMSVVAMGSEAIIDTSKFNVSGRKKADVRYAVHRSEKHGIHFAFGPASAMAAEHSAQVRAVSGSWLRMHRSPELAYSLGTLASLADDDIVVGLAFAADGSLEAFVSWLPVPMRRAWTLDLMRRRPGGAYGVVEALIARSIEEARRRDVREVSLGVTPRVLNQEDGSGAFRAMYWGLDRFQRSGTLQRFKEKFGPRWEDRYLVVPTMAALPEVMVALVRAHMPPITAMAAWLRSLRSSEASSPRREREFA